jgi:hypothetical protein
LLALVAAAMTADWLVKRHYEAAAVGLVVSGGLAVCRFRGRFPETRLANFHLGNFSGRHRPKQPRCHVPSGGNRWRGIRRAWQLAGALTDFGAAAGGLLLGGFLVRNNSLTGKSGIIGLALLAAGVWFCRDGVKKLLTGGQG